MTKPDSKTFVERNVDEMLVKALIFVLYCTLILLSAWLYFERLKFGDLIPIRQIHQSFRFYGIVTLASHYMQYIASYLIMIMNMTVI